MQPLARGLLRLRLALPRFGAGPLLAGALLVAAALLWLGLLPGMAARVDDETHALARLRSQPAPKPVVPAPVLAAGRLADFYAGLGDSAHTSEIVTRLFEAADAAGVTLDKAEYKPGHDTPGRFDTYSIVLPVKGDYGRVRQFSEKVLTTVPYAALDDIRFKRNSANDPGVEANLSFTAFLRPVTIAPVSASAVAAAEAVAESAASGVASGAVAAVGASGVAEVSRSAAAASGASGAIAMPGVPTLAMIPALETTGTTQRATSAAVQPAASSVPLPAPDATIATGPARVAVAAKLAVPAQVAAAHALAVVPVTVAPAPRTATRVVVEAATLEAALSRAAASSHEPATPETAAASAAPAPASAATAGGEQ
ncbi:hypothetical protein [Paraburkholderia sp. ZP32-5]|uniref:hypothetical protein n=1 Tax=Paraburkholderia sp. ZP32-5 TaxID=2883245 RepID=UPI001F448871|nr:hypothetical protein [Paraburkholderia sp. ZP32-5]